MTAFKALVTGGTGFIGSHVVRKLLDRGIRVSCLVRSQSSRSNLEDLSVEFVVGDLRDRSSLQQAVQGCQWLFHVAADYRLWAKNPQELFESNVQGTENILEAAWQAGVEKIVYTSSVSAIGRPHRGIGDETIDPTEDHLIGPYKRSKFQAELVARRFGKKGLPVVIVNPSTPIGSHDIKPTPTGRIILDFLKGKMPGYVDTGMNLVDVEDVAEGHLLAAEKGEPNRGKAEERYILGGENLTLRSVLHLLSEVAGKPAPRLKIPYIVAYLAGAVSTGIASITGKEPSIPLDGVKMSRDTMYYDSSKAVRELGMPQGSIKGALQKACRWFQENGYL